MARCTNRIRDWVAQNTSGARSRKIGVFEAVDRVGIELNTPPGVAPGISAGRYCAATSRTLVSHSSAALARSRGVWAAAMVSIRGATPGAEVPVAKKSRSTSLADNSTMPRAGSCECTS